MDISQKTVTELKAIAYDLLVQIEGFQKNLAIVNAEIAKKLKSFEPPKDVPVPEETKAEN
jgi:hypothetical protein